MTAAVMNELISLLATKRNIPQAGLEELYLSEWEISEDPLDDSLIKDLFAKCHNLTNLTVGRMKRLSLPSRMTLARQVAIVLDHWSTNLKTVDLNSFCNDLMAKDN